MKSVSARELLDVALVRAFGVPVGETDGALPIRVFAVYGNTSEIASSLEHLILNDFIHINN
jgi:hypothetical protein